MMVKSSRSAVYIFATLSAYLLCILILKVAFYFDKVRACMFAWSIGGEYLGDEDVVFQKGTNDCGPAALMMIFEHYHLPVDHERIIDEVNPERMGTSMLALKKCAEHQGLRVSAQMIRDNAMELGSFPLLVYIGGCHFAVIDTLVNEHVIVRDPKLGKLKLRCDYLYRMWQGECLMFSN